jgi:hypothetical protein
VFKLTKKKTPVKFHFHRRRSKPNIPNKMLYVDESTVLRKKIYLYCIIINLYYLRNRLHKKIYLNIIILIRVVDLMYLTTYKII